jgi:hypothetical protein
MTMIVKNILKKIYEHDSEKLLKKIYGHDSEKVTKENL